VTGISGITQADRARWQQRAAAELGSILRQNPDLPCIGWTVGPAGPVLAGHVNGLAPAAQVRAVFDSWRHALVLEDYREHRRGGGTAFLDAAARRNQVRIRLTATVFGEEPEAGQ
jgi:hypothetical protein